jgi:hypothetical protein
MTRATAATEYRTIRNTFLKEHARFRGSMGRWVGGSAVDARWFDQQARSILRSEGNNAPTPADFVITARHMLNHWRAA